MILLEGVRAPAVLAIALIEVVVIVVHEIAGKPMRGSLRRKRGEVGDVTVPTGESDGNRCQLGVNIRAIREHVL